MLTNGTPESGTSEIETSIEILKRHKSPGVDQIHLRFINLLIILGIRRIGC